MTSIKELKVFLTGQPGSGKSTVMLKSLEKLRGRGFTVGGIATPEVRVNGKRIGFNVVDLASGAEAPMARVDIASSYRVGKYFIDLVAFESVAMPALDYAERSCDIVAIDEIGRMELFSKGFERRVDELISGVKPILAVLHRNFVWKYRAKGIIHVVSQDNRELLPDIIVDQIETHLRSSSR